MEIIIDMWKLMIIPAIQVDHYLPFSILVGTKSLMMMTMMMTMMVHLVHPEILLPIPILLGLLYLSPMILGLDMSPIPIPRIHLPL
jgi:hypothetical protein